MRTRIYTLHHRRPDELVAVADRFDLLGLVLPPLWLVWHGLWITLAGYAAAVLAAALWSPWAGVATEAGIALIFGFEGGAIRRAELRLRGWREAGVVEARSPEGAEELFLRGEAA